MKSIGIDIGTTTICGVVIENQTGKLSSVKTLPNTSAIVSENTWEKLQDVSVILTTCIEIIEDFLIQYEDIDHIGLTGQMHGIVYVDSQGSAITPLITWQDGRGNLEYQNGMTYSSYMSEVTGYSFATGFGLVTHFYNQCNHMIPKEARCFCTIADYIAMKLANSKTPLVHQSMAASFGGFCVAESTFDQMVFNRLHINRSYLPAIASTESILGTYQGKISVSIAFGDNQASFLGSVSSQSNVLINIGTGSQISISTNHYDPSLSMEYRPYVSESYLVVGSALCGGASYALLKQFFEKVIKNFECDECDKDYYEYMNRAAKVGMMNKNKIKFVTCFNGTRKAPEQRARIENIGTDNFTPEDFSYGVLQGMSDELYEIYDKVPNQYIKQPYITGSGNGIRKNPVLREICEQQFGKQMVIPYYSEEAAFGSALFALYCSGYYQSLEQIQALILLEKGE